MRPVLCLVPYVILVYAGAAFKTRCAGHWESKADVLEIGPQHQQFGQHFRRASLAITGMHGRMQVSCQRRSISGIGGGGILGRNVLSREEFEF
jgi:hypothetical protein